jgi:5-methylthioadenosine/S-adenosylhomocysteine deaminase
VQPIEQSLADIDRLAAEVPGERIDMARCEGVSATLGLYCSADAPGGVVAGRPADLVVFNFMNVFACLQVNDPGATILTTGTPRVADMVLVGGEVAECEGRSTYIDGQLMTKELAVAVA